MSFLFFRGSQRDKQAIVMPCSMNIIVLEYLLTPTHSPLLSLNLNPTGKTIGPLRNGRKEKGKETKGVEKGKGKK